MRRMAVREASLGLGLPGIAGVVKQYRLPMVLEGFFQLDSGFPMKGLGRQEGLLGNGCIGVGHGVALLGGQQNAIYWEMGGLYATEQTAPLSATTLTLGLQEPPRYFVHPSFAARKRFGLATVPGFFLPYVRWHTDNPVLERCNRRPNAVMASGTAVGL
jgi:hypothetical protein